VTESITQSQTETPRTLTCTAGIMSTNSQFHNKETPLIQCLTVKYSVFTQYKIFFFFLGGCYVCMYTDIVTKLSQLYYLLLPWRLWNKTRLNIHSEVSNTISKGI